MGYKCLIGCTSEKPCRNCYQRDRRRILYKNRREQGLCYTCGGIRESELTECKTCRDKFNPGRKERKKLADWKRFKKGKETRGKIGQTIPNGRTIS